MATKKITDLTQLTDLDATDSFVVNDSGAGADKRVEFSDLQSEVLNGAAIGTSTAITELQVDNLNLNGNTISSTDTNGNITIDPNGTGSTIFGGDVLIDDKIIHSGDTNTAIRFPAADTVTVETAGSERMRIDSSGNVTMKNGLVVNEDQGNFDFRVEGDNDSHLIFADASADRVGIGTSTPAQLLDVDGVARINDNLLMGGATAPTGANGAIVPKFSQNGDGGILSDSYINKIYQVPATGDGAATIDIDLTGSNISASLDVSVSGSFSSTNREGYAAYKVLCNRETNSVTTITVQAPTNKNGTFTTGYTFTASKPNAGTLRLQVIKPAGAVYTIAISGHIHGRNLTGISTTYS